MIRVWLRDSEYSSELPTDIKNRLAAMHAHPPDFYPLDELEEDARRRETGVFTAACKDDLAAERLKNGDVTGVKTLIA